MYEASLERLLGSRAYGPKGLRLWSKGFGLHGLLGSFFQRHLTKGSLGFGVQGLGSWVQAVVLHGFLRWCEAHA